jgi:hypothetical protein
MVKGGGGSERQIGMEGASIQGRGHGNGQGGTEKRGRVAFGNGGLAGRAGGGGSRFCVCPICGLHVALVLAQQHASLCAEVHL